MQTGYLILKIEELGISERDSPSV